MLILTRRPNAGEPLEEGQERDIAGRLRRQLGVTAPHGQ